MQSHTSDLQLCHALPGRSRFRISTIRRNPEAATRLEAWLARFSAVHSAHANPVTGTLLVYYSPQALAPPDLERQLRTVLADGLPPVPISGPPSPSVSESPVPSALRRFLGLTGVMGIVLARQFVFMLPVAQSAFSPLGLRTALASLPLLRSSFEHFREDRTVSLESFLGGTTLIAIAVGEAQTALEVL